MTTLCPSLHRRISHEQVEISIAEARSSDPSPPLQHLVLGVQNVQLGQACRLVKSPL